MVLHKCQHCDYTSSIKSNLTRHINNIHTETRKHIKCEYCDCVFTLEQNVRRHMMTRCKNKLPDDHLQNVNNNLQNDSINLQNISMNLQNVSIDLQNVSSDNKNDEKHKICNHCGRVFYSQYTLTRHEKNCKGKVASLQCHLCFAEFKHASSKSRHLIDCTLLHQQKEEQALVPSKNSITSTNHHNNIQTQNIHNGDQNTTTNNTTNNNTVNNTINNNITLLAFRPEDQEQLRFITDHISIDKLVKILELQKSKDILSYYTREVMEHPDNQCVKKTNLRSCHSSIHVGNNRWETRHDSEVYPKLVADVASGFGDEINAKRKMLRSIDRKKQNDLIQFSDYMSDNGYCADEEREIEVKMAHRELLQRTKAIAFDITTGNMTPTIS